MITENFLVNAAEKRNISEFVTRLMIDKALDKL